MASLSLFRRKNHAAQNTGAKPMQMRHEKQLIFRRKYGILNYNCKYGESAFMNKTNYGSICETLIREADNKIREGGSRPRLLLHVCCAPCSSYCLAYLEEHFDITLYFYNPNITEKEEFSHRQSELERFVSLRGGERFPIISPEYDPSEFLDAVRGVENIPEGGERCIRCYRLRLESSAKAALADGFDYFTTTLSISPYKNSEKLNTIGAELEREYGVRYLYSDFKKKGGYARSIALSGQFGLYRQDYCGCSFSAAEAERRKREKESNGHPGI